MAPTYDFCRAQEALQRDRAAGSLLENVRVIATKAAAAWNREALLAQNCEATRKRRNALPEAASLSEETEDSLFSENPDRGLAA
jgi:hypothetical protein